MKNYNEMATDVFSRISKYQAKQKRKRKKIVQITISFTCICLVSIIGIGLWKFNSRPPQTAEDAIYPGIKDTFDEQNDESADNPNANNKIIVNKLSDVSADKYNICLHVDDFVEMSKEELKEYYGINVFPTVPLDIKEWGDQCFGIYKRNKGTGEVYWDGEVLNYSNEDFSRTVNVEITKESLPLCDYLFLEPTYEKSIINNLEVIIGQTDYGYYYAQFMYQNIGFQFIGEGLSQEEFVEIISSIIK